MECPQWATARLHARTLTNLCSCSSMLQRWHGARRWDTCMAAMSCVFYFFQILDTRWHGIRTSTPGVMYDHGRKIVHGTDGFCRAFCDDSPFAYTDDSCVALVCFCSGFLFCHFLHPLHIGCFAIYDGRISHDNKHLQLAHGALFGRGILCYYCVNARSGALAR